MKLDSVMNLQAEIFESVFDFVRMPEPTASAAAEKSIPTYIDPRAFDAEVVLVELFAVSEDEPKLKPMAELVPGQVPATQCSAGKSTKRSTDDIALGVGRKLQPGSDEFELVAVYQDRHLKNSPLLGQIKNVAGARPDWFSAAEPGR